MGAASAASPARDERCWVMPAGPVDPRLLAFGRTTRRYLALTVALGVAAAAAVVVQAWGIATVVAGAFREGRSLSSLRTPVIAVAVAVCIRALLTWLTELS